MVTQELTKPKKKVDVLTGMLSAPSVMKQFENALGKSANAFLASVIDLFNGDTGLQECEPSMVVKEALKAAVLKLPINKSLGFAYIIAFNNSVKVNGKWDKVKTPTFQLGYKGYIQLAMRTGQYRTINADVVYEGELQKLNKLTGEIAFDGEKTSDKVIGYFCYFELLNGFSKTLYMSVENIANHAKRYSKGLDKEISVENLIKLANMPFNPDSKAVGWSGNFHGMAIKTVIRLLLSKYGYLSIEMQEAIANEDEATASEGFRFEEAEIIPQTEPQTEHETQEQPEVQPEPQEESQEESQQTMKL
ncbi:MAG: recombination and repair protein RecT [Bacteroidetes bacterium ADurb.Bin234]|nr:MAG: recombination and repair protein RecT [Bacteroidetes bacterium ADurb.Bin234]